MKRPHSITFTQPSLTQQHSKDEVDINKIMARYIKTGVIDHVAKYEPQYTDNTALDYHESQNIILKANDMFSELPSPVRKQFNNDPASFLDFVSDESNHSKLQEMGLTTTPPQPSPPTSPPQPVVQPTEPNTTPPATAPAASPPTTPTATGGVQPL